MPIIGTFNSMNIVALPCDTMPGVTAPSSIEWDAQEVVAVNQSPFTGQTQTYDWQTSWLEGQVSFPPMNRYAYDMWSSFVLECRGQLNCFLLGDPRAKLPKGTAAGTPVVSGAGQTGYSIVTRGWQYPNPLVNPVFNQGSTGWNLQTGWAVVPGIGPANEPFVAEFTGSSTAAITNNNQIFCTAGTVLTASCKTLGQSGAPGNPSIQINYYNSSNTLLGTTGSTPVTADANWHSQSVTATAPSGTSYAVVNFAVYTSTSTVWYVSEFNCTNPAGGTVGLLLVGDYIQIGFRLYKVTDVASCDGNGNATISVWPNLRDQPVDGTAIITRNCKGLFRLAANNGNKFSVNVGAYGSSGFKIREAI